MDEWIVALKYFHFLRPLWLIAALVIVVFWWKIRKQLSAAPTEPTGIAEHLAQALRVDQQNNKRFWELDCISLTLILISLAVAGPSWSRIPSPLVAQTAPLAVVFSQSLSMNTPTPAPSRLERAKYKLRDLLKGRAGARTSLTAYAGTAHRVVPLTEDPNVLLPFIEGLSPEIMPEQGANLPQALEVGLTTLATESLSGAILFILDQVQQSDREAFIQLDREDGPVVVFYSLSDNQQQLDILDDIPNSTVVLFSHDNQDIEAIERKVALAYQEALAKDERLQWDDNGWIFSWPALLLTLLFFRRGKTLQLHFSLLIAFLFIPQPQAQAEGVIDWFLTPDQQGQLAYNDLQWEDAANKFQDPNWKAFVLYSSGKYDEAEMLYKQIDGADAAFAKGMALMKRQRYSEGIAAFELALQLRPEFARAKRNIQVGKAILDYVEAAREAQDTKGGSEGADEVVYDKKKAGGFDTYMKKKKAATMQTADQWMRTVDTRADQFLKLRFQLEAQSR